MSIKIQAAARLKIAAASMDPSNEKNLKLLKTLATKVKGYLSHGSGYATLELPEDDQVAKVKKFFETKGFKAIKKNPSDTTSFHRDDTVFKKDGEIFELSYNTNKREHQLEFEWR